MAWDSVFDEVAALVSVHPNALHSCVIRHESGNSSAVVRGGHLCQRDNTNPADSGDTAIEGKGPGSTPIDVTALEECLNAAVVSSECQDVDKAAKGMVPDWVLSELGSGISVECMISPEANNLEGYPVLGAFEVEVEPHVLEDAPRVLYLPPVRVSVHCSATYPDHEPALEVYAPWLEMETVERLFHAMRTAAAELGEGAPVMLTWLECVQHEVTQYLQALIVRPGCGSYMIRSLPGCSPIAVCFHPEASTPDVRRYHSSSLVFALCPTDGSSELVQIVLCL